MNAGWFSGRQLTQSTLTVGISINMTLSEGLYNIIYVFDETTLVKKGLCKIKTHYTG